MVRKMWWDLDATYTQLECILNEMGVSNSETTKIYIEEL